ncbi:unnamed protein product [Lactuca virosa]|uniref:Uncharacterized protein n=1 Tax=Lactuca virosa TaxID=75947 RepID=A0AAU9M9Y3_9ASTR|nr:unnamed protein product [Lactuca virosa]
MTPGNLCGVPLVVLPPPTSSKVSVHVEDNKEGILAGETSRMTRKMGLLSLATLSDVAKGKTVADCCHRRKLATKFIANFIPSSEEVISILDDDTHQSKGIPRASKQPVLNKVPTGVGPTEPPLVQKGKSPTASETSDYDNLIASFQGKNISSNNLFIPKWNLTNESHLSQQEVAATLSLREPTFFFTAGVRRILHLKSVVVKLRANGRGFQQHIASLESSVESSRRQLELLAGDKMTLEEHYAQVDAKIVDTLQQNEALSIQVESLKRELLDKEKLLLDREAELSCLGNDLDWLVEDGIGVGRIKNMCFAAGEESDGVALSKEVVVGAFDPNAASSTSSHSGEMVDEIKSFISYDYASMMKLGSLDIDGLCQLCADDDHGGVGPNNDAKITRLDGGVGK